VTRNTRIRVTRIVPKLVEFATLKRLEFCHMPSRISWYWHSTLKTRNGPATGSPFAAQMAHANSRLRLRCINDSILAKSPNWCRSQRIRRPCRISQFCHGIWPSRLKVLVFLTIATHHTDAGLWGFGDATFVVDLHSSWRPDICGNVSNSHSAAVSKFTLSPIRRFWTI
jgi:hypothetical protein